MQNPSRIFLILILLASTPAMAMGHISAAESMGNPLIGRPAVDTALYKSDGGYGPLLGSRQGEKSILIFWATWCPHCYEELGILDKNSDAIRQKGIKIILVDVGETKEEVIKYFNRRQMRLTSFIDQDSTLQAPYRLRGVPTLMFIDEKGIIRNITHQFPSDYEQYFNR